MKLRDTYDSLDELCASEGIPRQKIEELLRDAGFEYNSKINSFR